MAVEIKRDGARLTIVIEFMSEDEAADTCEKINEELAFGYASLEISQVAAKMN